MNIEQENFKKILDKHCQENMTAFTSNDFHTIWNAIVEYDANTKNSILQSIDNLIELSVNGNSICRDDPRLMGAYTIRIDALKEIKTLINNLK